MNITKSEADRIMKPQSQGSKVIAVTLRKNDSIPNKKSELRSVVGSIEQKINAGKEITIIVVESQ